jgi:hypothetical protein
MPCLQITLVLSKLHGQVEHQWDGELYFSVVVGAESKHFNTTVFFLPLCVLYLL